MLMVLWNPCLWVSRFEKHFKEKPIVASNTPTPTEAQIAGGRRPAHFSSIFKQQIRLRIFPRRRSPEMRSSFRLGLRIQMCRWRLLLLKRLDRGNFERDGVESEPKSQGGPPKTEGHWRQILPQQVLRRKTRRHTTINRRYSKRPSTTPVSEWLKSKKRASTAPVPER